MGEHQYKIVVYDAHGVIVGEKHSNDLTEVQDFCDSCENHGLIVSFETNSQ